MNHKLSISALIMTAGVAAVGGLAYANTKSGENDAVTDLARASVSLTQAVSAAESQSGGKAIKAELDGESGAIVYQVEVVTPAKEVFDVRVDAADGKVLSSKRDRPDQGEKDDRDE